MKVWFDEWELQPRDNIPAKIEQGLERCRVPVLCMPANAFSSDGVQSESDAFCFRGPWNESAASSYFYQLTLCPGVLGRTRMSFRKRTHATQSRPIANHN